MLLLSLPIFSAYLLLSAQGATIADLITARSATLGKAAAAVSQNPQWAQPGAWSLFIASDAAIAASKIPQGSLGKVLVNQTIDYKTANAYQVLKDLTSDTMIVYENKNPGTSSHPDIRCRFGTGEALAVEQLQADNGWLYILNTPIEAPKPAAEVAAYQGTQTGRGTSIFLDAVGKASLGAALESLSNSTIFLPIDSAFTGLNLSTFTADQLRAILLYHVVPGGVFYSTALKNVTVPSALEGQALEVAVSAKEGVTVNGARVVLADVFTTAGVIHLIDKVLVPKKIPDSLPIPGSTPTTSSTSSTSSSTAPSSSAKTSSTSVALNSGVAMSNSLLSAWIALATIFFM